MDLVLLGSGGYIKSKKNKYLHSRGFGHCRSSYVLKKLSDQDEGLMTHKGGIKCYGGEKAMITGNFPELQN